MGNSPIAPPVPSEQRPAQAQDGETEIWIQVRNSGKREYFDVYLQQYPNGKYAAQARVDLQKLVDKINQRIDVAADAYQAGRYKEAAHLFREIVKLDAKHVLGWHFLGRSLAESGDTDAARQAFEKALEIQPTGKVAERTREQLSKLTNSSKRSE